MRLYSACWNSPPRSPFPERAVGVAPALGLVHEDRVIPAPHLVEAVADDRQEVGVRRQDRAVEGELDDALRAVEGGELARVVGVAQRLFRDVGGAFEHAVGLAVAPDEGVVAPLDPDLAPALGDAPVLGDLMLAPAQRRPELPVGVALVLGRVHEQRMVLPPDLLDPVAEGGEEVGVGVHDPAVEIELDQRLRGVQRVQLRFELVIGKQHLVSPREGGSLLCSRYSARSRLRRPQANP